MIVCVCKGVSDRDVARAITDGATSIADVTRCTRAGSGCGSCHVAIQQSLDMAAGRTAKPLITLRGQRVVLRTLAAITV
jgi:bacterioferritin-associated ferredoxin